MDCISGANPCQTCSSRNTLCDYRDITRRRRRKRSLAAQPSISAATFASQSDHSAFSPELPNPAAPFGINTVYNAGVSASDESSSSEVKLHYGPTSYFSLLQYIYKSLIVKSNESDPSGNIDRGGEVQEVSAGLDKFSMRRIFFGFASDQPSQMPVDLAITGAGPSPLSTKHYCQPPLLLLSPDLARSFMTNFLKKILRILPIFPKGAFERNFDQLYPSTPSPSHAPSAVTDPSAYHHTLLALALGSLTTPHHHWGDFLFNCVKTSFVFLDDVVNAKTIHTTFLMISLHRNFQCISQGLFH